MSVCDYCGEKAGWFQSSHPACAAKAESTGQTVTALALREILAGRSFAELHSKVQQVLTDDKVKEQAVREALLHSVNDAISKIALQSPVSDAEHHRLFDILLGYDESDAWIAALTSRRWFGMPQLDMSNIVWKVLNNITPDFCDTPMFNLRSGETPIFQTGTTNVMYAEERTTTTYPRSFGGFSLPAGGGIYYHIGGSQGHPVRTPGLRQLDIGGMLITSRALYFGGQQTTLRIPLDGVLRYQSYLDAVGVCESHGAPKVFVFYFIGGMYVGWFFYGLLSALTKKQRE